MSSSDRPDSNDEAGVPDIDVGALLGQVVGLARAVPGVRFAERQVQRLERLALKELSARLEDLSGASPAAAEPGRARPAAAASGAASASPAQRLERLLRRSMHQTPAESHASLVELVLQTIVPDEARIMSALADGSRYPLVHVDAGGLRKATRRILANASSVGRAAGVALPDRVPAYMSRLIQLGLVEVGPADDSLHDEYEILLTDGTVRRARERAAGGHPRFVRATVQISELGLQFWLTCRPEDDNGGAPPEG